MNCVLVHPAFGDKLYEVRVVAVTSVSTMSCAMEKLYLDELFADVFFGYDLFVDSLFWG